MLIDRSNGNTNKGSKRWINKLISFDTEQFKKNLIKLLQLQYYLKNPDIRLYSCVNDRKLSKAINHFQHAQLDLCDAQALMGFYSRINDKFCSSLMQPENKNSRYFLWDLDVNDPSEFFEKVTLTDNRSNIIAMYQTVSGYHVVTKPFDPRPFGEIKNCDLKKDGLLLLHWLGLERKRFCLGNGIFYE